MLNSPNLRLLRHYGVFGDGFCNCHICREKRLIQDRRAKIAKKFATIALIGMMVMVASCKLCHADIIVEPNVAGYSLNQWCKAIYKAENSKSHPYGILAKYKHTTPFQACKNTILHAWRDYKSTFPPKSFFLDYLANRYCPINSNTDNGTCKNWPTNVRYWLEKGEK